MFNFNKKKTDKLTAYQTSFKNYFNPMLNRKTNRNDLITRFKEKMHKNRNFRNNVVISLSVIGKL